MEGRFNFGCDRIRRYVRRTFYIPTRIINVEYSKKFQSGFGCDFVDYLILKILLKYSEGSRQTPSHNLQPGCASALNSYESNLSAKL